jgi:hypothetical protein
MIGLKKYSKAAFVLALLNMNLCAGAQCAQDCAGSTVPPTVQLRSALPVGGAVNQAAGGKDGSTTTISKAQDRAMTLPVQPASVRSGAHPLSFASGLMTSWKRRGARLMSDPLVIMFPVAHPLKASKYAEEHGYLALMGIGTCAASSVAAVRR